LEDFGTPIEELKISGWSKKANQEEQMEELSIEIIRNNADRNPPSKPFLKDKHQMGMVPHQ
jgi:hypothetical protein